MLPRISTISRLIRHNSLQRCLSTTIPASSGWNKDWMPGPYPTTPEQRAKAAKKYGLRPEDYEPIPLDGPSRGDYPDLPLVPGETKDPWEDYDFPEMKRNYGEPLHKVFDIYTESRVDPTTRDYKPKQILWLVGIVIALLAVGEVSRRYPLFQPMKPKEFPFNGLYLEKGGDPSKESTIKHYTFQKPS